MKLIIADDEILTIEGLKKLNWEEVGVDELLCAQNGTEAYQLVSSEKPDILLTDIEMPHFSGLELARIISAQGLKTRIIILSGHSKFIYAQQAIRHNVCDYLLKPCSPKDIMASVARVVNSIKISNANNSFFEMQSAKQTLSDDSVIINDILKYIENNYMYDISLSNLSDTLNYSSAYLSRLIKEKTNYNFLKLVTMKRMQRAAELLSETNLKVYVICEKVGITDQRYFSQIFKRTFGVTPLEYRHSKRK